MELLPHAPPERRRSLARAILAAARVATDAAWLVRPLVAAAGHAPPVERALLLDLTSARLPFLAQDGGAAVPAIIDAAFIDTLQPAEPPADETLLDRFAAAQGQGLIQELSIATIEQIMARIELGAALPPHRGHTLLVDALTAIAALPSAYWQAQLFDSLAPHLTSPMLPAALACARALPSAEAAQMLLALLPRLPDAVCENMLAQALDAARDDPGYAIGASYLADLAPYLPDEQRVGVWREALAAARAIEKEEWRAGPLVELIARLPEELLPEALDAAASFRSTWYRRDVLAALAPRLSGELLQQAAALAQLPIAGRRKR